MVSQLVRRGRHAQRLRLAALLACATAAAACGAPEPREAVLPYGTQDAGAGGSAGSADARPGVGGNGSDAQGAGAVGMGGAGGVVEPLGDAGTFTDGGSVVEAGVPGGDNRLFDFESGNGAMLPHPIRRGSVYAVNDGTPGGVQQPAPQSQVTATRICAAPPCAGGPPGSTFALHVTASGFTTWGSFVGSDLTWVGGMPARRTYDASAAIGVAFWARLGAAPAKPADAQMRFVMPDANTDPEGGQCAANGGAMDACYNDWGVDLTLTTAWQRFEIPFASLRQRDWGKRFPAFQVNAVYGLQWKFAPSTVVDVWLDDVVFMR